MKKIVLLSSSRADIGIYKSLIREIVDEEKIELHICAFGTHVSRFHGYTIDEIQLIQGIHIHEVHSMLLSDSKNAVASAMGLTSLKFADFWDTHSDTDIIISLGDRFEMTAAVFSSIPYNIEVLHIHGGETTLGAIDNKFRHALTIFSKYHFTSTENHAHNVARINDSSLGVYNIGSLSLDNVSDIDVVSKELFMSEYGFDLNQPTILITIHPETIHPESNHLYIQVFIDALRELRDFNLVITMPNADTYGQIFRDFLLDFSKLSNNVFLIENFGSKKYFSCMKYCSFLLGNTSSGIIEAASFNKYAINVGDRQKGRERSNNVIDVPFNSDLILAAVKKVASNSHYTGSNIYKCSDGKSSRLATNILKQILNITA